MKSLLPKLRLLVGTVLVAWLGSAGAYVISLQPDNSTVALNGEFSIDLVLSGLHTDGQILSVYDLTIAFDLSRLQFVAAVSDTALGAGSLFFATPGIGSVELFELSFLSDTELAALQGDTLTLATLSFEGIGEGTSLISPDQLFALGGSQFLDPNTGLFETTDLLALPHSIASASASVVSVPEPGTLLLLALVLPLLLARVNRRER